MSRKNKVPQPFSSVPLPEEVEYLNDIRVYDTQHLAWHGVRARGRPKGNEGNAGSMSTEEEEIEEDEGAEFSQPEGRYGEY